MQVHKVGIAEMVIDPLANKLKSALILGRTLWLVTGGSNIKLAIAVMNRLDSELSKNLVIGLSDERYGPYDHTDSNWHQLKSGRFDPKHAQIIEVLSPDNFSLEKTVQNYAQHLAKATGDSKSCIGLFGMGADGHIAGILPGSIAADNSSDLVIGYKADPFIRITIGFKFFGSLDSAFLVVFGEEKRPALENLVKPDINLTDQPAQIIKRVSNAYLFNDQVGSKEV